MKKFLNIAIDGPAGAGKSTIAKAVAKELEQQRIPKSKELSTSLTENSVVGSAFSMLPLSNQSHLLTKKNLK